MDLESIIQKIIKEMLPEVLKSDMEEDKDDDFRLVRKEFDVQDIDSKTNLSSILNSITYIKLLVAIEGDFNLAFVTEELDISWFQNIEDLATAVINKING